LSFSEDDCTISSGKNPLCAQDYSTFGGVMPIGTSIGQTAGQIGAGVVARLTRQGSAFATVNCVTSLGGEHQRTVTGNAGVRWTW
jgi:outer membrane autotransporter protein